MFSFASGNRTVDLINHLSGFDHLGLIVLEHPQTRTGYLSRIV